MENENEESNEKCQECVDTGLRVRRQRRILEMSQEELGKAIGLDRATIGKIEAGRRDVKVCLLFKLSRALNVPARDLLPD